MVRGRVRNDAAQLLSHLLADSVPYRDKWRVHVRRASGDRLHQRAIAQVISEHLWESGQVDEQVTELPRQLRDRVSRALSGEYLSPRTLQLFIDAFEMSDQHARALWDRHRGGVTTEQVPGPAGAQRVPVSRDAYRTRVLDEYHQLGPDGLPASHQTFQVIEAIQRLERYSFLFDTASASVEVLRGGTRGATYPHPAHPGIHATDIVLRAPLAPGDTTVLGYRTVFHYDDPPPPEFRRMFRATVQAATMEVRFDPRRLPTRLWWATWPALDAPPGHAEPVTLEANATAHRFLENVEKTIVGFYWEWD